MQATISNMIFLLFLTVLLALLWGWVRVQQIVHAGNRSNLPKWIQGIERELVRERPRLGNSDPGKAWRWFLAGLYLIILIAYLSSGSTTPVLIKVAGMIVSMSIFGGCVYYCDNRMG
jgi:hypothetical protein